jgi:hypothetical protein
MSNHTVYEASIKAAGTAATVAKDFAETTKQGSIAAASSSVGYRPGFPGNFSAYDAACKSAAAQKLADLNTAEMTKQAAISIARDLLRSQNELP